MTQFTRYRLPGILSVLVVSSLLGLFFLLSTPRPRLPHPVVAPEVLEEGVRSPAGPTARIVPVSDLRRQLRTETPASSVEPYGVLVGVRDVSTGLPLAPTASCDLPEVEITFPYHGELLVAAPTRAWSEGFTFTLSAPGYGAVDVSTAPELRSQLSLSPSSVSIIHVLREGQPVLIEQVHLTVPGKPELTLDPDWWEIEDDGGARITHGCDLVVHLYDASGRPIFGDVVRPRSEIWVRLEGESATVRLQRPNGTPIEGAVLANRSQGRRSTPGDFVSGADGLVHIPVPAERELELEIRSPGLRCAASSQESPLVDCRGEAEFTLTLPPALDEPVVILLEDAWNVLTLHDAETGAPLNGPVYLSKRILLEDRPPLEMLLYEAEVQHGAYRIPQARGLSMGDVRSSRGVEFRLAMPGYLPHHIKSEFYLFGPDFPQGSKLFLDPVTSPHTLHLTDLGVPVTPGVVSAYEESGELVFAGPPSDDLTYGPFVASGHRLSVVSRELGPLGEARREKGTEDRFTLELSEDAGSIRVVSESGQLPRIVCLGLQGSVWRPSFHDGRSCLFQRLPPGPYLLGPEPWTHQIRGTPDWVDSHGVQVEGGMELTVLASPLWNSAEATEGRVVLSDGVPVPRVLVSYVEERVITEGTPQVWLAPDGTYTLPAGGPKPRVLALVDQWGDRTRIRGLATPGGVSALDERLVRLHAGGRQESTHLIDVRFSQPRGWGGFGAGAQLEQVEFRVSLAPGRTLEIPIHRSVRSVSLTRHADLETSTNPITESGDVDLYVDDIW